jgi:hypothetical protein
MTAHGDFWPNLHNLSLSIQQLSPDCLSRILSDLGAYPRAIQSELAKDLKTVSLLLNEFEMQFDARLNLRTSYPAFDRSAYSQDYSAQECVD